MKRLLENISRDELYERLSYNPNTGLFLSCCDTKPSQFGRVMGCKSPDGYVVINLGSAKRKRVSISVKAHRLAWFYMTGKWPENQIDHINGIKHDNRICNLRQATNAENQQNIFKAKSNCKSGLRGASFSKSVGRWHAQIRFNGRVRGFVFDRQRNPLQPSAERPFLRGRVGVVVGALVGLVASVSHCRTPCFFPVIPSDAGLDVHIIANLKPMPRLKLHSHL